jgi:hypothetical protein
MSHEFAKTSKSKPITLNTVYSAFEKKVEVIIIQSLVLHQGGHLDQAQTNHDEMLNLNQKHFEATQLSRAIANQKQHWSTAISLCAAQL